MSAMVRRGFAPSLPLALLAALCLLPAGAEAQPGEAPQLRTNGAAQQLYVDGKPFLILGAELFNSTPSSAAYLAPVLDRLQQMHANTVLAPVGWDQIEPVEGRYDFAMVDATLAEAARRDMRVVLLWLGAFKNARSTYAPVWARADRHRFPRAVTATPDEPSGALPATLAPVLSSFTPALREVDGRAFRALMAHLAQADRDHRVVMVQVENETGLLGDSRDRSAGAQAAWNAPVPAALLAYLARNRDRLTPELKAAWQRGGERRSGTWEQVFGRDVQAEEIFSAWSFASYVEQVARQGRTVSSLPFYTNTWLGPQPGQAAPGTYPSGGPTAAMIDVWKAAAPSLAFVSPDIYIDDARGVQARYARPDNPLFVPEERLRPGDLFWAIGQHGAIGQASFGVDNIRPGSRMEAAYALLRPMADVITAAQAESRIAGILIEGEEAQTIRLGGYTFTVRGGDAFWRRKQLDAGQKPPPVPAPPLSEVTDYPVPPDTRPFGLVIDLGGGEFLFAGQGFLIDVARDGAPVEIDRIVEGRYERGAWVPGRWLNGDDYGQVVQRDRLGAARLRVMK